MFGTIALGEEPSKEFFERWVQEVKDTVPKERMLVFEVKQGNTSIQTMLNNRALAP